MLNFQLDACLCLCVVAVGRGGREVATAKLSSRRVGLPPPPHRWPCILPRLPPGQIELCVQKMLHSPPTVPVEKALCR